jgi:hypothetical protein
LDQYRSLLEITRTDYKQFLHSHAEVEIGETKIKLQQKWTISKFAPSTFTPETTTVWSFPDRGDWATHVGNYRGNWSPYIPRNLILRYTAPGELVLDQMAGSGTTLVECKLLGRRAVGMDINPDAVMVARNRLDFSYAPLDADYVAPEIKTYLGDARSLDLIENESIDLIATHPPYASIIPYSHNREGDLSKTFRKGLSNEGVCKAYPNTAQAEVSAFERAQYRRIRRGNEQGRRGVHARPCARETLRHPHG